MKRQDVSGQNTLHTDASGGGAATDVNVASVGGTPVTSPLPVSGTVTITPSGTQDENLKQVNGATVDVGVGAAGTGTQRVAVASNSTIATVTAVTAITNALPAGSNVIGHVITDTGSTTAVTGTITTKEARAATSTLTNVGASASSVTVLALNANRLAATIDNDSTVNLYAKFGATASTSSFTVKIPAGAYYEVPGNYTGIIDGIWDSATGNARVTELTA